MLLNTGNDKHVAAKQRVGEIIGHGVQYEVELRTPDLEEELGISCFQFDILDGILIVEIDGDDHKGKIHRQNDKRRDCYTKSKGYITARLPEEEALKFEPLLLARQIIYQVAHGPVYS